MSKNPRMPMRSDSSDYHKGYLDGRKSAFDESELDAYYAGVGYGKKAKGTKHLGFTSDEERRQFEAGVSNSGKHFRSYRAEPPSFLERLFFGRSLKHEAAVGAYSNKRVKKQAKRVKKRRTRYKKRRSRY